MKIKSFFFLGVTLMVCQVALAKPKNAEFTRPNSVTIYRDGYAYFEENLKLGKNNELTVRLPAQTDVTSIKASVGNISLRNLEVEAIYKEESKKIRQFDLDSKRVIEKVEIIKTLEGYILYLRKRGAAGVKNVILNYGSSGISWTPRLDVTIEDKRRVALELTALIDNQAFDLRDCRVYLASGAGNMSSKIYFESARYQTSSITPQSSRAADVVYDLGRQNIPKDKTTLITFLTGKSRYKKKIIWNTDTRERVRGMILTQNPFKLPLCPAKTNLYDQARLISQDYVEWAPAGGPIALAAGNATGIVIERSVVTKENLARKAKARPFNHAIKFTVTNNSDEDVAVEVIMQKRMGSRHKTIYKFKKEPNRRPGQLMIWELAMKKGQREVIAFSFDSEYQSFSGYQSY
ncbi:MAG: DUF4139 domain-containing protein, partial [Deltaproteobacteria bacterium]|nr:DUF4139 domain-containing protein [Deltaproteobacteria bacterium]